MPIIPAAIAGLVIRELNMCWFPYRLVFALQTPFPAALDGFLASSQREHGEISLFISA
jgi:hypothetical protein